MLVPRKYYLLYLIDTEFENSIENQRRSFTDHQSVRRRDHG